MVTRNDRPLSKKPRFAALIVIAGGVVLSFSACTDSGGTVEPHEKEIEVAADPASSATSPTAKSNNDNQPELPAALDKATPSDDQTPNMRRKRRRRHRRPDRVGIVRLD